MDISLRKVISIEIQLNYGLHEMDQVLFMRSFSHEGIYEQNVSTVASKLYYKDCSMGADASGVLG